MKKVDAMTFFSKMIDAGAVVHDSGTCKFGPTKYLRTRFASYSELQKENTPILGFIDSEATGYSQYFLT